MFFSSLTKDERPYFINDGLETIYYLPTYLSWNELAQIVDQ